MPCVTIREGKAIRHALSEDPSCYDIASFEMAFGWRVGIAWCIPVRRRSDGGVFGCLQLNFPEGRRFDAEDEQTAAAFSRLLAMAHLNEESRSPVMELQLRQLREDSVRAMMTQATQVPLVQEMLLKHVRQLSLAHTANLFTLVRLERSHGSKRLVIDKTCVTLASEVELKIEKANCVVDGKN